MDKHLNYFWVYGRKNKDEFSDETGTDKEKTINNLENNITRSIYVTFDTLKHKNMIDFINRLLLKEVLNPHEDYIFDNYELQQSSKSEIVKQIKEKYLIGFCPNGDLKNTTDFNEIVKLIKQAKVDGDSNPDLTIIVKNKKTNENVLALVFENKKTPLKADQMKRHLEVYMGITNPEDYKDHLIIRNYLDFFNLFEKYNRDEIVCRHLLDYMNYLCFYNKDIGGLHLNEDSSDEDKRNAINSFSQNILPIVIQKAGVGGELRYQGGWGWTINFGGKRRYINMIGLVCNKQTKELQLNIKFAPNMSMANAFYHEVDCVDIGNRGLSAHFAFQNNWRTYINGMEFSIDSNEKEAIKKYFCFFKGIQLHEMNKTEASKLLFDMKENVYSGINVQRILSSWKNEESKYYVCPTLQKEVSWSWEELQKKNDNEKFADEIAKIIKQFKTIIEK